MCANPVRIQTRPGPQCKNKGSCLTSYSLDLILGFPYSFGLSSEMQRHLLLVNVLFIVIGTRAYWSLYSYAPGGRNRIFLNQFLILANIL